MNETGDPANQSAPTGGPVPAETLNGGLSATGDGGRGEGGTATPLPAGPLAEYPWLTFLMPFAVFMLVGALEPKPPSATVEHANSWFGIGYHYYPHIYALKIALTLLAMWLVWPGYRTFSWRWSWLSVGLGVVGGGVWIGLCRLQLEPKLLAPLGLDSFVDLGQRSAFDPLTEMANQPVWAYGFLCVRFIGLVFVVAVIEEFFLRGFVMRFVMDPDWWKVPFGQVSTMAMAAGTVVPMATHPGELLAALVWFSSVTWLMVRTKNIWDCVIAHAITNLVLGCYVVASGDWWLM